MSKSFSLGDKIIYIKVENSYAVWFKASRNFLMVEEPAFYILKSILKNVHFDEIVNQFSVRYKIPTDEVSNFVSELDKNFQQYLNHTGLEPVNANDSNNSQNQNISFYSEKTYSLNNIVLKINYGDSELEDVIHPLISHFENEALTVPTHFFEIYRLEEKLLLKIDDDILEKFNYNDTGHLKAALLLKLLSILHGIKHESWMMTIHAAAISDGNSAIVFPAVAGSGKSTLAALLYAYGFNLLSDDFLAMDTINKNVYPLPVAATIKEGSFDVLSPHFPELNYITLKRAYTGKQVRYLPINNLLNTKSGFKADKFVFINYSHGKPLRFERVRKKEALQILLSETWINPTPSIVAEFFNWFDKTKFFEMEYSKTSDALKIVKKLFKY